MNETERMQKESGSTVEYNFLRQPQKLPVGATSLAISSKPLLAPEACLTQGRRSSEFTMMKKEPGVQYRPSLFSRVTLLSVLLLARRKNGRDIQLSRCARNYGCKSVSVLLGTGSEPFRPKI